MAVLVCILLLLLLILAILTRVPQVLLTIRDIRCNSNHHYSSINMSLITRLRLNIAGSGYRNSPRGVPPPSEFENGGNGELRKGPVNLYHMDQLHFKDKEFEQMDAFPGPLTDDVSDEAILEYLDDRLKRSEAPTTATEVEDENDRLLLGVLRVLVKCNGKLRSDPGTLNPSDPDSPEAQLISLLSENSMRRSGNQPPTFPAPRKIQSVTHPDLMVKHANQLRELLLVGDRKGAVSAAITAHMWPEAMLIASFTDKEEYRRVLRTYLDETYTTGDPCRIQVEAPMPSSKMALLGADHRTPDEARFYVSPGAVQRTEIYEWAQKQSKGSSANLMIPFQGYKLIYAMLLADHGKLEIAFKYVTSMLTAMTQVRLRLQVLVQRLREHSMEPPGSNHSTHSNRSFSGVPTTPTHSAQQYPPQYQQPPSSQSSQHSQHSQDTPTAHPAFQKPAPLDMSDDTCSSSQPKTLAAGLAAEVATTLPPLDPATMSGPSSDKGKASPKFKSVKKPGRSKTPPPSGSAKSSGWLSGLSSFIATKMNPEAKVAKLGEQMEAYFDEDAKRWVFPGEQAAEEPAMPSAPPTGPISSSVPGSSTGMPPMGTNSAPGSMSSGPAPSNDPLAALMAPPPSHVLMKKDPLAAMMAPPARMGGYGARGGSTAQRKPPRPQFAVFKPSAASATPDEPSE
eukprot:jgi/Phyca11/532804/estExt2_fgenesh1_pg.C_PHYCAscaffold_80096